jgi:hypothetical protein
VLRTRSILDTRSPVGDGPKHGVPTVILPRNRTDKRDAVPYLLNSIAIVFCGAVGAVVAFFAVSALGGTGVGAAIAMALVGMVTATLLWILGVVAGRAMHLIK